MRAYGIKIHLLQRTDDATEVNWNCIVITTWTNFCRILCFLPKPLLNFFIFSNFISSFFKKLEFVIRQTRRSLDLPLYSVDYLHVYLNRYKNFLKFENSEYFFRRQSLMSEYPMEFVDSMCTSLFLYQTTSNANRRSK